MIHFKYSLATLFVAVVSLGYAGQAHADGLTTIEAVHPLQGNAAAFQTKVKLPDQSKASVAFPNQGIQTAAAIHANGYCINVYNPTTNSYFIPLKTAAETAAFVNNAPAHTGLIINQTCQPQTIPNVDSCGDSSSVSESIVGTQTVLDTGYDASTTYTCQQSASGCGTWVATSTSGDCNYPPPPPPVYTDAQLANAALALGNCTGSNCTWDVGTDNTWTVAGCSPPDCTVSSSSYSFTDAGSNTVTQGTNAAGGSTWFQNGTFGSSSTGGTVSSSGNDTSWSCCTGTTTNVASGQGSVTLTFADGSTETLTTSYVTNPKDVVP
jgi:hypothetical protein